MTADVARIADGYGINLRPGPFADTRTACLGFFYAQRKGLGPDYRRAVFAARWLEEKDIADREVLIAAAEACQLDRSEFIAALDDPQYADMLDKSKVEADEDSVFGFPFFVVGKEKFWGDDRIEWLVRYLKN